MRGSVKAVENLPWRPLSPEIGHQTNRFWGFPSPISGRYQLDIDFFNSAPWPLPGHQNPLPRLLHRRVRQPHDEEIREVRSSRQPICSPPTVPGMAVILPSLVPLAVSLTTYISLPFDVLPGMGKTAAGAIGNALRYSPVAVEGLRPQAGAFGFSCDLQDFSEWRDPDSNRGHHDFQTYARALRYAANPYR